MSIFHFILFSKEQEREILSSVYRLTLSNGSNVEGRNSFVNNRVKKTCMGGGMKKSGERTSHKENWGTAARSIPFPYSFPRVANTRQEYRRHLRYCTITNNIVPQFSHNLYPVSNIFSLPIFFPEYNTKSYIYLKNNNKQILMTILYFSNPSQISFLLLFLLLKKQA